MSFRRNGRPAFAGILFQRIQLGYLDAHALHEDAIQKMEARRPAEAARVGTGGPIVHCERHAARKTTLCEFRGRGCAHSARGLGRPSPGAILRPGLTGPTCARSSLTPLTKNSRKGPECGQQGLAGTPLPAESTQALTSGPDESGRHLACKPSPLQLLAGPEWARRAILAMACCTFKDRRFHGRIQLDF